MNIPLAVAAAASQLVIRVVVGTTLLVGYVTVLGVRSDGAISAEDSHAIDTVIGPAIGITVGILSAFFMGWWGARDLKDQWIAQGLLIAFLIVVLGLLLDVIIGGLDIMSATWLLDAAGAVAGSAVARSRALARAL